MSKEVMPYNVYTYENVTVGACSIQSALDVLKGGGNKQFLDNLETWDCIFGKGMDNQMFGFIEYSNIHCKMDCKVLMACYEVLRQWMLEHTELDVYNFITTPSMASSFMLKSGCHDAVYQNSGAIQQYLNMCCGWQSCD